MGWYSIFDGLKILVGALLGTLTGLGIGGGSLLVIWLHNIEEIPFSDIKIINLLFFFPAAIISCLLRKNVFSDKIPLVIPAAFAGSVSAIVFSILSSAWDISFIKRIYGGILILIALRELFCAFHKRKST